jgi:hypothetical protein
VEGLGKQSGPNGVGGHPGGSLDDCVQEGVGGGGGSKCTTHTHTFNPLISARSSVGRCSKERTTVSTASRLVGMTELLSSPMQFAATTSAGLAFQSPPRDSSRASLDMGVRRRS